jgi:hypothetical protein
MRIGFAAVPVIGLAVTLAFAAPARAQGTEVPGGQEMQSLIDRLKQQLDRGERERLIDPWFLRDLRQTLSSYEHPWRTRIFEDDFSGRGPQPDPPWQVTAGDFLVDWRHGLRTVVENRPAAQQQQQGQTGDDDSVKQLFGQILSQALKDKSGESGTAETASQPGYAAAIAPVAISNAFALRLELTSRPVETTGPRFEFGPYQGANAAAGYRLAYVPRAAGGTPSLELLRLSARGTVSTLEIHAKPLDLQDGEVHVFEWTRDTAGRMVIKLDGEVVMEVVDRSFRDPFDGIALVNSGGDYALRRIVVDGV